MSDHCKVAIASAYYQPVWNPTNKQILFRTGIFNIFGARFQLITKPYSYDRTGDPHSKGINLKCNSTFAFLRFEANYIETNLIWNIQIEKKEHKQTQTQQSENVSVCGCGI